MKMAKIDKDTHDAFLKARERGCLVNKHNIIGWAANRARELGVNNFRASNHWLTDFKARHDIRSRAATKMISNADRRKKADVDKSITEFRSLFTSVAANFEPSKILNIDQTGINYDIAAARTLNTAGARDVEISVAQRNQATHSYTTQPMVSRDGKLIGKLMIVLQEDKVPLGSQIKIQVEQME